MSKRVFDTMGSLIPVSIIPTLDTAYIVIGIYEGHPPVGYPSIPGGFLHTTFYAKFDDNFNLVWFKLHYGPPLNDPYVVQSRIDPHGITAVPASPEDYIILNFGWGYDTLTHSPKELLLIDRIDGAGNLVKEVHPNMPSNFIMNINTSINYLPANGFCAITGGVIDMSIASGPQTPYIFTFDPMLNTVFNFTRYASGYNNFVPSNVVEDQANPTNLLFGFTTGNPSPYTMGCCPGPKASSLVYLKVKAAATSTILVQMDYTSPCMEDPRPPLTIKNIFGEPDNIMFGFSETQLCGYLGVNRIPSLLKLKTTGSVINYHHYNPLEPKGKLQYFENYDADSFILHINQLLIDTTNATRIIKTDGLGRSFCTELPVVDTFIDSIVGIDSSLILIQDSTVLVDDYPVLNIDSFIIDPCDSPFAKPAPGTEHGINENSIKVFPNPAYRELNVTGIAANTEYRLLSLTGQCVSDGILQKGTSTISIGKLPPGLYVLELKGSDGHRNIVKVIKE